MYTNFNMYTKLNSQAKPKIELLPTFQGFIAQLVEQWTGLMEVLLLVVLLLLFFFFQAEKAIS